MGCARARTIRLKAGGAPVASGGSIHQSPTDQCKQTIGNSNATNEWHLCWAKCSPQFSRLPSSVKNGSIPDPQSSFSQTPQQIQHPSTIMLSANSKCHRPVAAVVDGTADPTPVIGTRRGLSSLLIRPAESSKAVGYLKATVTDSNSRNHLPVQHLRNRVARESLRRGLCTGSLSFGRKLLRPIGLRRTPRGRPPGVSFCALATPRKLRRLRRYPPFGWWPWAAL